MAADRTEPQGYTETYPAAGAPRTGGGGGSVAGQQAGGSGQQVKEKVQQVAGEAQHKIGDQLRTGINSARDRTASTLDSVAQSLVQSGVQARERDPQAPGQYVERAGRELQRVSEYLKRTDADQAVRELEGFARRQPAVFLGAAFAIGLLGARFIKSSQRAEQQEQFQGGRDFRSTSWQQEQISDRERPVAGFREPGASIDEASVARSPGDIRGRAGDPEWSGTPGGFSNQR